MSLGCWKYVDYCDICHPEADFDEMAERLLRELETVDEWGETSVRSREDLVSRLHRPVSRPPIGFFSHQAFGVDGSLTPYLFSIKDAVEEGGILV